MADQKHKLFLALWDSRFYNALPGPNEKFYRDSLPIGFFSQMNGYTSSHRYIIDNMKVGEIEKISGGHVVLRTR